MPIAAEKLFFSVLCRVMENYNNIFSLITKEHLICQFIFTIILFHKGALSFLSVKRRWLPAQHEHWALCNFSSPESFSRIKPQDYFGNIIWLGSTSGGVGVVPPAPSKDIS